MPRPRTQLAGKRVGMLTVIEPSGSTKEGRVLWLCKCDCGNTCVLPSTRLVRSEKTHCGCQTKRLMSEAAKGRLNRQGKKTHDGSKDRLYRILIGMIDRCEREGHVQYANYGGRGIKVCEEWRHDYQAFKEWAYANGYDEDAPKGQCTIDRIDPDGDYSPSNCRFVSMRAQQNNRRNNHLITMDGKTQTMTEWCRELGLSTSTVGSRIRHGWSPVDALTRPVRHELASKRKVTAR